MIFTPALPLPILIPGILLIVGTLVYNYMKTGRSGRKQKLRLAARTLAVLLIILSMFRPAIPTVTEIDRLGTNMDIYFALDTTASMGVRDIADPNSGTPISRLDYAKQQIMEIAETQVGARYSLVTFDVGPKPEVPLVRDLSALASAMELVQPQPYLEGLSRGTDTLIAVPTLLDMIETSAEASPERVRVVYYITDGENTANETTVDPNLLSQIGALTDQRAAVGMGTETGDLVPLYEFSPTGYEIVENGTYGEGVSAMNAEQISLIAEKLGTEPTFISSTSDYFPPVSVDSIEEKLTMVDKDSPAQFEFYWVFLIIAGLLLIVDMNSFYSQIYRLLKNRGY